MADKWLELIHTDLCDPLPINLFGGKKYILAFLNDHSIKVLVYLIKAKNEVIEYAKNVINLIENQTGDKVNVQNILIMSDNGTEYVNRNLDFFCLFVCVFGCVFCSY